MENNLLLEQYSRYKKIALKESHYSCLLNAHIDPNPHQVNAFCAAVQALKTGGIILADEVGLGKTIEAGLVINYVIKAGARNIMIVLPATLRKQWEIELEEKFNLESSILDRLTVDKDRSTWKAWLENSNKTKIAIVSYDYSSKLMKTFPKVKWDFIVIDEAHNLRNVFHGTKRAKNLYEITKGIPKILLTATPLQNRLSDLHGLASFIDDRIFGPEKIFNRKFVESGDYSELKEQLSPILYRTLRKDVGKYMDFKKRTCITVDFTLSDAEAELYNQVNAFLKRKTLYSIPVNNRSLIILVIRKLLASSSFALVETFEVFKERLNKLYQGSKSANAQEGFDLFLEFLEDEIDESDFEDKEDEDVIVQKQEIQEEIELVQKIIDTAVLITENAKVEALKTAISTAFEHQKELGIDEKVVVFTESKRTQKYIASELRKSGYSEADIILFNGDFDDSMTKEIYRAWQVKNYGNVNYGRIVEYKHAIVDYFKNNAKILIVTDSGSEGLNLQFCNTVINYDLPWNPQKIEQRIGRCHRYGQKHDVVAINLLNTENEANRRVYEILRHKFELFDGVFGASDVALGALQSGTGFEQQVLNIYQSCDSNNEFDNEFDKLDKKLDSELNSQAVKLQNLLITESPNAKEASLDATKAEISEYLKEVEYWNQFNEPEMDSKTYYWQIDNWGRDSLGSHGTLFLGAFCNNTEILFPVLLLCDENGEYVDFDEKDIVTAIEDADDSDIKFFTPTPKEQENYRKIYDKLLLEMSKKYEDSVQPIKDYNKEKIDNWFKIQIDQISLKMQDLQKEIENLLIEESMSSNRYEKEDILKKAAEKKKQLDKQQDGIGEKVKALKREADRTIEEFNAQYDINPVILVNIVLKF